MYGHDWSFVSATVTVVRGWPDSDKLFVEHVFVSFLYQLMGTGNEVERIDMVELDENTMNKKIRNTEYDTNLLDYTRSKKPTSSSRTNCPVFDIIWIRPHQICKAYCYKLAEDHHIRWSVPQNEPSWGISWALDNVRIESNVRMSGERPPCTQRVVPSMIWDIGIGRRMKAGMIGLQLRDSGNRTPHNMFSILLHCRILSDIHLKQVWDMSRIRFCYDKP